MAANLYELMQTHKASCVTKATGGHLNSGVVCGRRRKCMIQNDTAIDTHQSPPGTWTRQLADTPRLFNEFLLSEK